MSAIDAEISQATLMPPTFKYAISSLRVAVKEHQLVYAYRLARYLSTQKEGLEKTSIWDRMLVLQAWADGRAYLSLADCGLALYQKAVELADSYARERQLELSQDDKERLAGMRLQVRTGLINARARCEEDKPYKVEEPASSTFPELPSPEDPELNADISANLSNGSETDEEEGSCATSEHRSELGLEQELLEAGQGGLASAEAIICKRSGEDLVAAGEADKRIKSVHANEDTDMEDEKEDEKTYSMFFPTPNPSQS